MNDNGFDSSANSDKLERFECRDITARLGDLIDNELAQNEKKAVEEHLDVCPDCASFFASYRHVIQSAAELREPEQPLEVDVQNRLRRALNTRLGLNLPYIA
jgi:anti-sigma factor RsiW